MVLSLRLLDPSSTLNDFHEIGSMPFVAGSALTVTAQLRQYLKDQRYIPASGATVSFKFLKSDGTTLTKAGTFKFPSDDRSVVEASLTAGEAAGLIGQNLVIALTEGSVVSDAVIQKGLQQVILTQDC